MFKPEIRTEKAWLHRILLDSTRKINFLVCLEEVKWTWSAIKKKRKKIERAVDFITILEEDFSRHCNKHCFHELFSAF